MLDKATTSFDVNFDAAINADKRWLQNHMDAFWEEAAKQYPTAFAARNARRSFSKFISSHVFGENTAGTPMRQTAAYSYKQFSIKKPVPEMLLDIPEDKNLLTLWQSYLSNLDTDNVQSRVWIASRMKDVMTGMKKNPTATFKVKVGENSQRFHQYEEALQKDVAGDGEQTPQEMMPPKTTGTQLAWIIGPHPETLQVDPEWIAKLKRERQKLPLQDNILLAALNDHPAAAHVAECGGCMASGMGSYALKQPNPALSEAESAYVTKWETDRTWLERRISGFSQYAEEKAHEAGVTENKGVFYNKIHDLQDYLVRLAFQSPADAALAHGKATRFADYDVETAGGKINLLGLYRDYTQGLNDAVAAGQKWVDLFVTNHIGRLEEVPTLGHKLTAQARQLIQAGYVAATHDNLPAAEADQTHKATVADAHVDMNEDAAAPKVVITGDEAPDAVAATARHTFPSYWNSNGIALVAGLAGGVLYHKHVISLLEGVSRVAMNSVLNGAGYMLFGMVAGAAAGTVTTIAYNLPGNFKAVMDAPRGGKIKAFFNAVAESCSRGQIITNAVTGGLAGLAFGGIAMGAMDGFTGGGDAPVNVGETPVPQAAADITPTQTAQLPDMSERAAAETPAQAEAESAQTDTPVVTSEAAPETDVADEAVTPDAEAPAATDVTVEANNRAQANILSQGENTAAPSAQVEDDAVVAPTKTKAEPAIEATDATAISANDTAAQVDDEVTAAPSEDAAAQTETPVQPAAQPQAQEPTPAQEVLPEPPAAPSVTTAATTVESAVIVPAADTETIGLSSLTEDFKQSFRFETHAELGANAAHASDLDIALNPVAADGTASVATPSASSVTVKSGDTTTGIVMEAFNLTSETADMNGDGMSDLDQILREIQIANGMENSNQLNWIRPGGTLDLPTVDLNAATDTVDRATMDEGVKTRNVDFAPKFAA